MAHLHSVYDTDKHFTIDPITRDITNKSSKVTLMQYDHNSERFTFEIPRMIEGHDMTLCNCVRIHFINIGNTKTNKSEGVYEVDDIQISPDSEDVIIFSWLIKRSATEYNGSLNFAVRFYCIAEDSTVDYSWGTNIFSGIKISNGLDNSDVIVDDYIDVLEKWKNEVLSSIPPETIRKIESLDLNNMLILRDLDSGTYVLYGEFKPYPEADSTISFSSDILVTIIRRTNDSQVQIFYPHNNCVQYLKITDTSYERTNVYLNDLATKVYVDQTIPTNVIQYSEQALTEEQKLQARQNIGAGKPQVQPDWNQNDETAADYVKNRPFYTSDPVENIFVEESTVSFADVGYGYSGEIQSTFVPTVGETYKVTWDGIDYECTCIESNGIPMLGDINIVFGEHDPADEPFLISARNGEKLWIVTVDSSASHTFSVVSSESVAQVVKINPKYLPISVKPIGGSYLTFSSANNFTLSVKNLSKNWDGTLEYFTSDGAWTVWDGTKSLVANANEGEYALYLRGIGNTTITGSGSLPSWLLNGTDIKCIGNIENLLDYATVKSGGHPNMSTNCYNSMFYNCTSLTKAPALPATTLATSCYMGMFYNCTSLTQAPALPATTLATSCYRSMFDSCSGLKLSSTKTNEYTQEYRIPSSGESMSLTNSLTDMFTSTGGTFTGTPDINTTYYLSSDNMIIRDTDISTLNGYVGSMINTAVTDHIILTSSTADSTKRFKITVDDSGTVSATEITT